MASNTNRVEIEVAPCGQGFGFVGRVLLARGTVSGAPRTERGTVLAWTVPCGTEGGARRAAADKLSRDQWGGVVVSDDGRTVTVR